jgi:hypothetical protein
MEREFFLSAARAVHCQVVPLGGLEKTSNRTLRAENHGLQWPCPRAPDTFSGRRQYPDKTAWYENHLSSAEPLMLSASAEPTARSWIYENRVVFVGLRPRRRLAERAEAGTLSKRDADERH